MSGGGNGLRIVGALAVILGVLIAYWPVQASYLGTTVSCGTAISALTSEGDETARAVCDGPRTSRLYLAGVVAGGGAIVWVVGRRQGSDSELPPPPPPS